MLNLSLEGGRLPEWWNNPVDKTVPGWCWCIP